MAETLHIVTTYVLPSGIGLKPVADGHITARVCLGHIFSPGGVIDEEAGTMADTAFSSANQPVPWVTKKVRDEAIGEVERLPGLNEELRARLITHMKKSAYYEDAAK